VFKLKRLLLVMVMVFFVFIAVKSNDLFTDEAEKKPKKFKKCEACVPKTGQITSHNYWYSSSEADSRLTK